MSWISKRETTRPEDMVYSLMGLLDVSMPILYGEGEEKAFFRLQLEVMKISQDPTIFLWKGPSSRFNSMLAPSPRSFISNHIYDDASFRYNNAEYSWINARVRIRLPMLPVEDKKKEMNNNPGRILD